MRLRLILDAPLAHHVNPDTEGVLTLASPTSASPAAAAHITTTTTAVVWDINPNIPVASPVHLQRLQSMLLIRDQADFAFFLVTWVNAQSWVVATYADPARTAYDLDLREGSALYLTRDPHSALLSIGVALPLDDLFWVPPTTAALRFESIDASTAHEQRTLDIVGRTARRVWKRTPASGLHTSDNDLMSASSIARAVFPPATLPVRSSASNAVPSVDSSAPPLSTMRWAFRVGFEDPKNTFHRLTGGADWPVMYGDALFVRDMTKGRGNSLLVQSSPVRTADDAPDASEDSNNEEEESIEVRDVGIPLPSMLLGFGVTSALDGYFAGVDGGSHLQQPDGAPSPSSTPPSATSMPLYAAPPNDLPPNSCCLFDTRTGGLYTNGGKQQQQPVQYADLSAYAAQLGMILSFIVDPLDGVLNILQDERLILVATLPPRMREALASELHAVGGDSNLVLCPLVQLGTAGGMVDVF